MAYNFQNAIRQLENFGLSDVLLPFILIFTVVFAVMQKVKPLGEDKKNFNVIIALVMSLSVIIPHVLGSYPRDADVVNILNEVLPSISLIMVAILAVLLMLGVWGKEVDIAGSSVGGWITMLSMLIVFILFGSAANWFQLPNFLNFLDDPETKSLLIIILVFGAIISWVTKDDKETDTSKKSIGDLFGGLLKK